MNSGGASGGFRASENSIVFDSSRSIIEVCRELLNIDSNLKLNWTAENRSLYNFLKSRQDRESRLRTDMFLLTGLFVSLGSRVFGMIEEDSVAPEHLILSDLTQRYQILEDLKVSSPRFRVNDIVRQFPFYIAEHLDQGRGLWIGKLRGLRRCLAFSGGFDLIPKGPEWETLIMMWKLWRSSFTFDQIKEFSDTMYAQLYYVPISKEHREEVMDHFRIAKPSILDVLKAIEAAARDGNGAPPTDVFLSFQNDIKIFYDTHSVKIVDWQTTSQSS